MRPFIMRLLHDRSGNFGIMTALLLVPLLGTVGVAIDVQRALNLRNELQNAADAAAIGAIAAKSPAVKAALASNSAATTIGQEDARRMFLGQMADPDEEILDDVQVELTKVGRELTAHVTFTATIPTTLLKVIGKQTITTGGTATASNTLGSYIDFYMLLDNTPSMGVGATPDDISALERNTPDSCAFACHDKSDSNNYYNLAKKLKIDMRIDVVREATKELTDTAAASMILSDQYRMAVYTFGAKAEEAKLTKVSGLSSNMQTVSSYASAVDLMSIPKQNYNNDQTTDFDNALSELKTIMGTGGTGNTASDRQKVVFFVSDGLGDSKKQYTCTKPTTGTRCQEPIDTSYCKPLKDKGIQIAVLYTTYLPLPKNAWYNNWISPFQDQIATRMEQCASEGLFFEVAPGEGISAAMNALFNKVIGRPRLTN